jgi:Zn-dependent peptidase ImmA (M78 family)
MAGYKTDEDLEDRVRVFLKGLGLEHQVRPDLMTIIAKIKHKNPKFQYARIPDHEMPDAEAQWDSEKYVLSMRESVFVGMQRSETRANMSVAHELAHYLLRHEGLLNRTTGAKTSEMIGNKLRHQESEARRTGPIILAPEHLVPEGATAEQISALFGMSLQAATYRQEEIEGIRRRRKGEDRKLPDGIVDMLREAKRRGHPIVTKLDD